MKTSRRNFLVRLALYGSPLAGFSYGSLIEKNFLTVNRTDIPVSGGRSGLHGLKVALMADFHHDDYGNDGLIRRAVEAINAENVDVVMLAGDYISDQTAAMESLCGALSGLRPRLGSFGVLGNHDGWHFDESIPRLLGEAGIRLLVNESADFSEFAVAGADSYWAGRPDLAHALGDTDKDKPVILGWHEPDTFDSYGDRRIALQLSGHTHGGQICAPFHGPVTLPRYGKKYPFGHYKQANRSLYVTRGMGTVNIPARFLCAPEVAILTMRDSSITTQT
ncbi:MAG: metallophosphoesterase [Verrucomicrobiales bacterium]|nr:metallophosphoesterase [Verrucomicrobiales bacterium]